MHNTYTKLIGGIHKYFKHSKLDRAVIGVSGGVDSALCLKLTVDALGPENVTALLMPEKSVSSEENLTHAKMLCKYLDVDSQMIQINKFLTDFMTLPWKPSNLAQMNTKARIRMTVLYNYANSKNALVIGTSNKTELRLGYGTKHGDLAADLEVIGDLYKEQVYELAEHVGLPDEFIKKAPSAELYSGQTDELELGISYREIDNILKKADEGLSRDELISKGMNPNSVHKVFRLMELNAHKTDPTPIIFLQEPHLQASMV